MRMMRSIRNLLTSCVTLSCKIENNFDKKVKIFKNILKEFHKAVDLPNNYNYVTKTYQDFEVSFTEEGLYSYITVLYNKGTNVHESICTIKMTDDKLHSFVCTEDNLDFCETVILTYLKDCYNEFITKDEQLAKAKEAVLKSL